MHLGEQFLMISLSPGMNKLLRALVNQTFVFKPLKVSQPGPGPWMKGELKILRQRRRTSQTHEMESEGTSVEQSTYPSLKPVFVFVNLNKSKASFEANKAIEYPWPAVYHKQYF
jgi:hypothetical protein